MPTRTPSPPAGLRSLSWVLGLLVASLLAAPAWAQSTREYDLKAVFLYNFTTFVEWPKAAQPKPGQPLVIGILGRDPFGKVLDDVVAGEKVDGHPLEVRRYRAVDDAAREAHILYISPSEADRLPQILNALQTKPVLTVADSPRAGGAGAIISFVTGARVQLQINPTAAQQAGLGISSKLLRVATLVGQVATP